MSVFLSTIFLEVGGLCYVQHAHVSTSFGYNRERTSIYLKIYLCSCIILVY